MLSRSASKGRGTRSFSEVTRGEIEMQVRYSPYLDFLTRKNQTNEKESADSWTLRLRHALRSPDEALLDDTSKSESGTNAEA